jgi:hypothetical protein
MRIIAEGRDGLLQVLMHEGVTHDASIEVRQLIGVGEFTVDKEEGDFNECRLLCQLLNWIPAIPQDPFAALDLTDAGCRRAGVHEAWIVQLHAGQLLERCGLHRVVLDGDSDLLPAAVVDDGDGVTALARLVRRTRRTGHKSHSGQTVAGASGGAGLRRDRCESSVSSSCALLCRCRPRRQRCCWRCDDCVLPGLSSGENMVEELLHALRRDLYSHVEREEWKATRIGVLKVRSNSSSTRAALCDNDDGTFKCSETQ